MSGIASGITKVFTGVASTVSKVSQAVMGVGATAFTAGAATKAGPMAAGGFSNVLGGLGGGGVLSNILGGAVKQAAVGALVGGGIGALTGQGFGAGALAGAGVGAVTGGLTGFGAANTPMGVDSGIVTGSTATGMDPTGKPLTDAAFDARAGGPAMTSTGDASMGTTEIAPATGGGGRGFWDFVKSPTGGSLIAGLGEGLGAGLLAKQEEERQKADRDFLLAKEQRLRDSYEVPASALHSGFAGDSTPRPTPAKAYGRSRYDYNAGTGRIERV